MCSFLLWREENNIENTRHEISFEDVRIKVVLFHFHILRQRALGRSDIHKTHVILALCQKEKQKTAVMKRA